MGGAEARKWRGTGEEKRQGGGRACSNEEVRRKKPIRLAVSDRSAKDEAEAEAEEEERSARCSEGERGGDGAPPPPPGALASLSRLRRRQCRA